MPSRHEPVARALLTRLLAETERASVSAASESGEEFDNVLTARGRMLDALERSVQALAAATLQARSTGRTAAHESLLELASELERANTALMHGIRAERDLIAAALAAADRPDGIAQMYRDAAPSGRPHLDLVR